MTLRAIPKKTAGLLAMRAKKNGPPTDYWQPSQSDHAFVTSECPIRPIYTIPVRLNVGNGDSFPKLVFAYA